MSAHGALAGPLRSLLLTTMAGEYEDLMARAEAENWVLPKPVDLLSCADWTLPVASSAALFLGSDQTANRQSGCLKWTPSFGQLGRES